MWLIDISDQNLATSAMVNTRSAFRLLASQESTRITLPSVSRALGQAAKASFREKRRFQRIDKSQHNVNKNNFRSARMPWDDSEEKFPT
jgi:hypothetical protein